MCLPLTMSVFAALGLLSCGGGDGRDAGRVERAAVEAVTTRSTSARCKEFVTQRFVLRVYGDLEQCLSVDRTLFDERKPAASDTRINGNSATVKVGEGSTFGRIAMRKEHGNWRVDDLGIDFIQSELRTDVADPGQSGSVSEDPGVRGCVIRTLMQLSHAKLRRFVYLDLGGTDAGKRTVGKLLAPCLGGSGADARHTAAGRAIRRALVRFAQASKDKDYRALCGELLSRPLVQALNRNAGLSCVAVWRVGLARVKNPTLEVLGVRIIGDEAQARVRGGATGTSSRIVTIQLQKEEGAWRIASLATP